MPALTALLDSLIDYAGLFPPAKLPMTDAVRRHASYLHGAQAPYLGRFVVPVARLVEFDTEYGKLSPSEKLGWQLSVLAGPDPTADAASIQAFNARHAQSLIRSVEAKAAAPTEIAQIVGAFPSSLEIWIEVPSGEDIAPHALAIQAAGRRATVSAVVGAKIRTGGVTPDAFPAAADVARFMQACRTAGLVFKATAGLHHPLRGDFPLTYEPGSPRGSMFGFLNLFLAAALIHAGGPEEEARALLGDGDAGNFTLGAGALGWRERRFTTTQLTGMRKNFCRAFGSCSFTEPIEGLQQLHWL